MGKEDETKSEWRRKLYNQKADSRGHGNTPP